MSWSWFWLGFQRQIAEDGLYPCLALPIKLINRMAECPSPAFVRIVELFCRTGAVQLHVVEIYFKHKGVVIRTSLGHHEEYDTSEFQAGLGDIFC